MEKTFHLNDHLNPEDRDFKDRWDKIGQALQQLKPGLLEVSIKAINDAARTCPPMPAKEILPAVSRPKTPVYGPIGWPPMGVGGKITSHQGFNAPVDENINQHSPVCVPATQLSQEIGPEDFNHENCISGLIRTGNGFPIVNLTKEGIEQLNTNRGILRFVFILP